MGEGEEGVKRTVKAWMFGPVMRRSLWGGYVGRTIYKRRLDAEATGFDGTPVLVTYDDGRKAKAAAKKAKRRKA